MEKKLKDIQMKLYKFLKKYNNDDNVDILKLSQQIIFLMIGCECYFQCNIRGDRIFWAYDKIEHCLKPTSEQIDKIRGILDVTQCEISEMINNVFN